MLGKRSADELVSGLLRLKDPWRVMDVREVDDALGGVVIDVAHAGGRLQCPDCGAAAVRHGTRRREWREMDILWYRTRIRAEVPRVSCDACGGVRTLPVPWADRTSRFTAHFEHRAIEEMHNCSLSAAASALGISWDEAAGIQARAVQRGKQRRPPQSPKRLGVDETSFRKRHRYVTAAVDLDTGAVLGVAEGRTKAALDGILTRELDDAGRMGIEVVAMDMHEPYIRSVQEHTAAAIAFDKYHVAQDLSRGIDQVRRQMHRELGDAAHGLKRTRHLWLRRGDSLSDEQQAHLHSLSGQYDRLGRAWSIKEWGMSLWTGQDRDEVAARWRAWIARVQRCRLKPMIKVAQTVRRHLQGIVTAVCAGITNAHSESLNSRIQWIKIKARGYRNIERFKDAILFHLGKLDMRTYTLATNPVS